jgi:hypothetical protein
MAVKTQPTTTLPNLLNNFIFTSKLTFTITAEQQSKYGRAYFIIAQLPSAKTLST